LTFTYLEAFFFRIAGASIINLYCSALIAEINSFLCFKGLVNAEVLKNSIRSDSYNPFVPKKYSFLTKVPFN